MPKTRKIGAGLLTALLMVMGFSLATAPVAAAHDQVIATTPASQQQLKAAPDAVQLTFSGKLMDMGHEVRVLDAQNKDWVRGERTLELDKLTQPLQAEMPDGEYRVLWRVISSDGHPINGKYSFTVGASATNSGAGVGPEGAPSAAVTGNASSGAGASVTVTEVPRADGRPGYNGTNASPWLLRLGIGAGAGLGVYLLYLLIQRIRRAAADD